MSPPTGPGATIHQGDETMWVVVITGGIGCVARYVQLADAVGISGRQH
jgi:hypothetical protein